MSKTTKLSLEQITNETLWVVKYTYGWRKTCLYSEINTKDENIRDMDVCAQQPEHLKPFFNSMCEYKKTHGWITIPDYYKIWERE